GGGQKEGNCFLHDVRAGFLSSLLISGAEIKASEGIQRQGFICFSPPAEGP
ncbi:MAG: hypothetical protein ACI8V5_004445, partial [Limisphaerales bacterium]